MSTSHQRRYHYRQENKYSNTLQRHITNPKPKDTSSCRPLPEWEKSFCTEVGAMPWKRFVAAKKNLYKSDKVFEWDDSAGFIAFEEAKRRFRENYHGVFPKKRVSINAADMYIDKHIDWNSEIDEELFVGVKTVSDDEDEGVKEIDSFLFPIEKIIPTGWDCCDEPTPRLPTIVGS